MKQVRSIIRSMLLEMAWTGPKRVALLRQMQNPDIQRYIALIDAATTERELNAIDADSIIPNLKDIENETRIGDTTLTWALFDLVRAKESELRKAKKAIEKQRIADKKAGQQAKKDAVNAKVQQAFNNPVLMAALSEIGTGFHAAIKQDHIERETNLVKRYFTDGKFNMVEPDFKTQRNDYDMFRYIQSKIRPYSKKKEGVSYYSPEYKSEYLRDDWAAIIENAAERNAAAVVEAWKRKMALKLGEVIDRKGGADVKVNDRGSAWDNYLMFDFADGSSFYMRTQPVHATSKLGNHFTRFPTTFHNVKFHDGSFMEKPSSDKMLAEFGISDKTASVSTE